jgi:hypothetical protein
MQMVAAMETESILYYTCYYPIALSTTSATQHARCFSLLTLNHMKPAHEQLGRNGPLYLLITSMAELLG